MARMVPGVGKVLTTVDEVIEIFVEDEWIACDLETGGLSPWRDPLAVVSLYGEKTQQPAVLHMRGNNKDPRLKGFFERPSQRIITHNGTNFDCPFLSLQFDIDLSHAVWYDTLVGEQATLVTSRRDVSVSLQATAARRVHTKLKKDQGRSNWMAEELDDDQMRYCVDDIRLLFGIRDAQYERAAGTSSVNAIEFEQTLAPLVTRMVLTGLPFSSEAAAVYIQAVEEDKAQALAVITALSPGLNPNSPVQVKKAFSTLGYSLPSTGVEILLLLAVEHNATPAGQLARAILTVRQATKRGMYDSPWQSKYVHHGRVHSRFWQCGTDTGRFSSAEPNLQQVPKAGRQMFTAPPGWGYFSVDYNQIEILVAASIAKDERMLELIASGTDIHTAVAAEAYGVTESNVSKEMRTLSKAASFTLIFGGGAKKLHDTARYGGSDVSLSQCYEMKDRFLYRFQGIDRMRKRAYAKAAGGGPVVLTFPTGLRRVLVGKNLTATRILNNVVQGTAAAGLKYGILEMSRNRVLDYVGAVIHDETVGAAPLKDLGEVTRVVAKSMIDGMARVLEPAAKVGVAIGPSWGVHDDSYWGRAAVPEFAGGTA